jgi:LysM domain
MTFNRHHRAGSFACLMRLGTAAVCGLAGCSTPLFDAVHGTHTKSLVDGSRIAGGWSDGGADGRGPSALYHQARSGETLEDIAATYAVSAEQLLRANELDRSDGLKPGQLIFIPRARDASIGKSP